MARLVAFVLLTVAVAQPWATAIEGYAAASNASAVLMAHASDSEVECELDALAQHCLHCQHAPAVYKDLLIRVAAPGLHSVARLQIPPSGDHESVMPAPLPKPPKA